MMKLMVIQFWTFLVRSMRLSVEKFLRRAELSLWTGNVLAKERFSLTVFH